MWSRKNDQREKKISKEKEEESDNGIIYIIIIRQNYKKLPNLYPFLKKLPYVKFFEKNYPI